MAFDFRLPDLGEGIAEAEVRRWLVKEGDRIEEHQNVVELETDKAVIEVPTPRGGTVLALLRQEGETLRVGEALMSIAEEAGPPPATKRSGSADRAAGAAGPVSATPTAAEEVAAAPTAAAPKTAASAAAAGPEAAATSAAPSPAAAVQPSTAAPRSPALVGGPAAKGSASVVGQLPEADDEEPLATPGVRALARERGLRIEELHGTGYRGSVTREDVLAASARSGGGQDGFGEVKRLPLSATRRAIARRLRAAQDAAVYVSAMSEVDATELWALRARKGRELSERGIRLTFIPFILKALSLALKRHPSLNAEVDEEGSSLVLKKYVNIGVAVDGPEGLLVPVLRGVHDKTIIEVAAELGDLAERARRRELAPAELKGSSFTISNYGPFGGLFATPVPNYPDVAILGCGAIADRPWVVSGALAVRKILPLSLSFDHRVCDGGEATRFLVELGGYLEDPASLLLESR